MNSDDLLMRGEVREALFDLLKYTGWYERARDVIDLVPAVPREMTAGEYHLIKRRMCKNCPVCPLNEAAINLFIDCKRFEREYPEKAVAIVKNWALEHPEERIEK